eukprot:m.185233 g.185233  ORF g.185233 m.185233 type:complete len:581 (+) comp16393_c0_seq1:24-1766(+)
MSPRIPVCVTLVVSMMMPWIPCGLAATRHGATVTDWESHRRAYASSQKHLRHTQQNAHHPHDTVTDTSWHANGLNVPQTATQTETDTADTTRGPPGTTASIPVFNVMTFGAKGDKKTDDTLAFRQALSDAGRMHGGAHVYVPPGLFVLAGTLVIPPGVTLLGTYGSVPSHAVGIGAGQSMQDGSVLIPTGMRGTTGCSPAVDDLDCNVSLIDVQLNGVVRNLAIYYQEQETVKTPVPYPWTVRLTGSNAALVDVELLGCWNCIAIVNAHRHYVARVQGQAINIGLFVDQIHDIGRIENVHWIVTFSSAAPFIFHQTLHGRAFVFGDSDWQFVFNTFAYAYAVGYHFIARGNQRLATNGNFVGVAADMMVNRSVLVEQTQVAGILFVNSEFTAFCDRGVDARYLWHQHNTTVIYCPPTDVGIEPTHVEVLAGNLGPVKFVDSTFFGPTARVAVTDGNGTVSFSSCHFDDWDNNMPPGPLPSPACNVDGGCFQHGGTPAIEHRGGALVLSGNDFGDAILANRLGLAMTRHVDVGPRAQRTLVMGNVIDAGTLNITRAAGSTGRLVVVNNVDDTSPTTTMYDV